MKNYYCDDHFDTYPSKYWEVVLNEVLAKANYIELGRSFAEAALPDVLVDAEVVVPQDIQRVYLATNRFRLTPEVQAFVRSKSYTEFCDYEFENPAFYQDDILLLGTISHEDYVIMLLDETERQSFTARGFDFWCEWSF